MKILEVRPMITNQKLTDMMLKDEIMDDKILEQSFFAIKVESDPATYVDITYRRYWETMYVKNHYKSSIYKDYCILMMSLSEAIQFIYAATPPRLQHTIKAGISSCKNIEESLNVFLMENNNGELKHYISILKKILHSEVFETQWKLQIPESKTVPQDYDIIKLYEVDKSNLSIFKAFNPAGLKMLHEYIRTNDSNITNLTINGSTIIATLYK